MKVYLPSSQRNHTIYVQPANDYPTVNEWREPDGREKMFIVNFKFGETDVEDKLGEYLIEKGLAKKSPIITSLSEVA